MRYPQRSVWDSFIHRAMPHSGNVVICTAEISRIKFKRKRKSAFLFVSTAMPCMERRLRVSVSVDVERLKKELPRIQKLYQTAPRHCENA